MIESCTGLLFMKILKKPGIGLFLVYFLMNSLVFFGQDLSVRKLENGAWFIAMAEHNHPEFSPGSLNYTRQSCSHRHQKNEVHICIDHHKFLGPLKTSSLPGEDNLRSFSTLDPVSLGLSQFDRYHLAATVLGHDPGPDMPGSASSSILLL